MLTERQSLNSPSLSPKEAWTEGKERKATVAAHAATSRHPLIMSNTAFALVNLSAWNSSTKDLAKRNRLARR